MLKLREKNINIQNLGWSFWARTSSTWEISTGQSIIVITHSYSLRFFSILTLRTQLSIVHYSQTHQTVWRINTVYVVGKPLVNLKETVQ